jgi:hypothetical protein
MEGIAVAIDIQRDLLMDHEVVQTYMRGGFPWDSAESASKMEKCLQANIHQSRAALKEDCVNRTFLGYIGAYHLNVRFDRRLPFIFYKISPNPFAERIRIDFHNICGKMGHCEWTGIAIR